MRFRPEISSPSPYRVDVDAVHSPSIGGDTPPPSMALRQDRAIMMWEKLAMQAKVILCT